MKQKIIRADGIEYERNVKKKEKVTNLTIRLSTEEKEKIIKKAQESNKTITKLIIEKVIEGE